MNLFRVSSFFCAVIAFAVIGTNCGWDRAVFAQRDQPSDQKGVEVLTRGPIHEAFAQTVTFNPEPGITVPKAPPDAIEELPPDQKPAGDNVAWIPGYWAWDNDRDDYLWVSGIWRALPPGRQWVPGYWSPAGNEFQWTAGYWADAKLSENEYLPEPPATVEAGPNSPAPSANDLWIPGAWVWNQNRYAWQPGYWAPAQQNWMWVPAQYLWTPRGYVYVSGYYDYSIARRGVLFAPVYFNPSVYSQQGFTYSPAMAISMAVFGNQLFLRPNYNHYYFGDYYGSNYSSGGFYPWFSFNSGGYGYDPFYAQQRWQNRQNATWTQTVQTDYQNRVDNEGARPPRTFAAQQALIKSGGTSSEKSLVVVTPLDQLAKSTDSSLKFQPVTKAEQQTLAKHGQDVHQFREARQKLEAKGAEKSDEKPAAEPKSAKLKLPPSPILAKSSDRLDKDHTPPKTHEAPAADPKIEPKARQAAAKGESPKDKPTTIKAGKPVLPQGKPSETTDEPKGGSKPVPKTEPKPIPKAEPRVEPKPAPKVEPKPTPKVEPRVEPKPAPRVEPKPTPKVEPKVEPKPAPRVEPKPAPKVESKPAPRVEPKREQPKEEPKDTPKTEPKDKPKK